MIHRRGNGEILQWGVLKIRTFLCCTLVGMAFSGCGAYSGARGKNAFFVQSAQFGLGPVLSGGGVFL